MKNKGFTLMEIIVVIAIIGLLTTVVLGVLNSSKSRSNDATLQADMDTIRKQIIVVYDTNGLSYNSSGGDIRSADCGSLSTANTVFENSTVQSAIDHAASMSGNGVRCYVGTNSYVMVARYKSDTTKWWCIDNTIAKLWGGPVPPDVDQLGGSTSCQ